jgi:hypothetical protein
MNYLGGIGIAWLMLSGCNGVMSMNRLVHRTCGWPPRNKEILDNLAH